MPRSVTTSIPSRRVLLSDFGKETDTSVLSDSSNADATNTPTTRVRKGNVLVKQTSTGRFVEANDANADTSTQASITSSSHADGNGVIKIVGSRGTISVTTTTGTGTEANHATDLNADQEFAASYVASSAGGELTIKALRAGPEEWFYIHADTIATAGFSEGVDNGVKGTDPEVVVTLRDIDQVDEDGTAVHAEVEVRRKGHFDESNLINLTDEARAVLVRRGSIFG